MKIKTTISINPKRKCIMDEKSKKRIATECSTCFDQIQSNANKAINDLRSEIKSDFKKEMSGMRGEWAIFLNNASETLKNSVSNSERESELVIENSKRTDTNSKWILTIVIAVTFGLGAVTGYTYSQLPNKADRSEVLTKKELKMIHDITRAYNADQFVQNPNAKTDSTNYNWYINQIFSGTMRGTNNQ